MKTLLIIIMLTFCLGCTGIHKRLGDPIGYLETKCEELGFAPGTVEFQDCVFQLAAS